MNDEDKTKQQLLDELTALRQRVASLEAQAASTGKTATTEREWDRLQAILKATIESFPFDFFAIGLDGRYMLQNRVSKMRGEKRLADGRKTLRARRTLPCGGKTIGAPLLANGSKKKSCSMSRVSNDFTTTDWSHSGCRTNLWHSRR